MSDWVLKDELTGKYFKQWTDIGPAATNSLKEAERFDSERAAMMSPAYSHSMTFFEPVALPSKEWGRQVRMRISVTWEMPVDLEYFDGCESLDEAVAQTQAQLDGGFYGFEDLLPLKGPDPVVTVQAVDSQLNQQKGDE